MAKPVMLSVLAVFLVGLGLVCGLLTWSQSRTTRPGAPALASNEITNIGYGYGGNHKNPDQVRKANLRAEVRMANWEEASPHHWRIVGWVLECTKIRTVDNLPPYLRDFFNPLNSNDKETPFPKEARLPHHHEMALVQLSYALGGHRVALATRADEIYGKAQWAMLATVALGLVTTLVVSFNSTELGQGQGTFSKVSRFMAIVLTALGTAMAAVVAFYGPQTEWSDTKHLLASLTELHNFIGLETWKLNCLEFEGDKLKAGSADNTLVMTKFDEWSKRYHDLQTSSASANPSAITPPSSMVPANMPAPGDTSSPGVTPAPPVPK